MSATAALLSCPVCSHKHFESTDALRERLIFVSNNKLTCPICQEEMLGLDKLTIHLFCHVKVELNADNKLKSEVKKEAKSKSTSKQENLASSSVNSKKSRQTSKTKTISATNPVKFVKICPKPSIISLNTMPLIEITQQPPKPPTKRALFLPCIQPKSVITNNLGNEQICKAFRCDICGITFKDENMLRMHKSLIHNIEQTKAEEMTSFPCHMCSKVFKMRGSLMVHLRVAHYGIITKKPVDSNNLDEKTSMSPDNRDSEKNNEIYDDVKGWFCEICQKSFTTKYFLKKHKRLHTGETPYSCNICGKTFTFQQSYHKHLLYHNDEKPHSCSYCGRSFKELSTLHNHQRIHTGEKPFECETCGKCFRQRVSYLVHRRIHTGAMPYKCTSCEKSFRYKVSQRTHKCPAQPPGTVVRRTGDLLEMLIKRQTSAETCPPIPLIPIVSEANVEMARTGAKLSLEDTEAENFSFISKSPFEAEEISSHTPSCNATASLPSTDAFADHNVPEQENVPSPSEILKNLCLSNGGDSSPRDLFYENDINIQDFCREIDGIF